MTPHKGHLHLLPDRGDAPEEWIEDRPVSQLPLSPYQRRLQGVSDAEDRFFEELAKAADDEEPTD
jgi:hypothetical protein